MLLHWYACACGQPVISGLPLQHAQGALLLSCELSLRFSRRRSAGASTGGFGLRFGAAGSVGTSCFGLFLLPGGLPRRFGSVVPLVPLAPLAPLAPPAPCRVRSAPSFLIIRGQDITRTTKTTRRTTLPSRSVRRKRMCLRVTGPLRAMKCSSLEPVSTMVPTPLFSVILERMSSPWPAGRSAGRVVRHHPDELKDLLPAGDEA